MIKRFAKRFRLEVYADKKLKNAMWPGNVRLPWSENECKRRFGIRNHDFLDLSLIDKIDKLEKIYKIDQASLEDLGPPRPPRPPILTKSGSDPEDQGPPNSPRKTSDSKWIYVIPFLTIASCLYFYIKIRSIENPKKGYNC
jgi:hypothetical protein